MRLSVLLFAVAIAAVLDGCASAPSGAPAPQASAPAADTAYLGLTRYKECQGEAGLAPASWSAVVRYYPAPGDSVRRPFRIITGPTTGLCSPAAITLGPGGELFVLNQAPRTQQADSAGRWERWVTVYDSSAGGDATPIRVLHVQSSWLGDPSTMQVDLEGKLYLGSSVNGVVDEGSVAVFEPGADGDAKPSRVIAGTRTELVRPAAIAVDGRGFVYVLNSSDDVPIRYLEGARGVGARGPGPPWKPPLLNLNRVLVFAPGAAGEVAPARVIGGEQTGLRAPVSLALDRSDRLYVANSLPSNDQLAVTVHAASDTGDTPPLRRLTDNRQFSGRMEAPVRVMLDSHDSVFVGSARSEFRTLAVFASTDSTQPSRSFFRNAPALFALDRHDTLYTVERDSVKVFPPGYAGAGSPVRALAGPHTGIRSVTAMTLDHDGRLYLAVGDSATVKVYPAGASGDAAPARTIAGPHTRLARPGGIAVDRNGRLYVTSGRRSSSGGGAIRVYAAGARGEDQPIRILAAPDVIMPPASDIAFDSKGDLYLAAGDEKTGGRILVLRQLGERYDSVRSVSGPLTLLRGPVALAFGRNDTLYALNVFGGFATVTAYAPGAGAEAEPTRLINVITVFPERTIPGLPGGIGRNPGYRPLAPARDLLVDSTGAVQVMSAGGLLVYPPGAGEGARPTRVTLQQAVEGERGVMTLAPDGTVYQAISPYRNRGLFIGVSSR